MSRVYPNLRKMNKAVRFALPKIYGIGKNKAAEVCCQLGIGDNIKMNQIPDQLYNQMMTIINQNHLVDSELGQSIQMDIQRLIRINCYRGQRHTAGLPARGQRTHTNAINARKSQLEKVKKQFKL